MWVNLTDYFLSRYSTLGLDLVIAGTSRIKGAHEGIGVSRNIDAR